MKVVFDTNILVSAFTLPGERGDQAVQRIIQRADSVVISKPIIDELLGVLARKFAHDRELLARTAVFLTELAEIVEPRDRLSVLDDEPDNRIIECAIAAKAERIVSGDRAMLDLGQNHDVRIITLAE